MTLSVGPSSCYYCNDRVSPKMELYSEHCATSAVLLRLMCNHNDTWMENKYCEYSCFFFHNGVNRYPGIHCCEETDHPTFIISSLPSLGSSLSASSFPSVTSEPPSIQPSTTIVPSSVLSSNPTVALSLGPSECYQCDDRISPLMETYSENCETSAVLLRVKCKNDDTWMVNTYCEHSCFFLRDGINRYPGIWCCE